MNLVDIYFISVMFPDVCFPRRKYNKSCNSSCLFAAKWHLSFEMCNVCRLQHCTGLGQARRYYNDNCQENSMVSTEHQRLKNDFPLSAHFGMFKVQS